MGIAKDYLVDGVSQATFDTHQHDYIKPTRLGCDADDNWGSPAWVDIVEDGECHLKDGGTDLEAHGLETVTTPSSTPV